MDEIWEPTRQLHHLVEEGSDLPTTLVSRPDGLHGEVTSVSSGQQRVTLGRGAQCDVVLDDDRVSRLHAIVHIEGDRAWIEDAGSTNGTYVDGEYVDGQRALHDGAAIRFGRRGPVFRYGRQLPSGGQGRAGQGGGDVHYRPRYDDEDSAPQRSPGFGE